MTQFFVTGTDTDVGKSVACAWLMLHLGCKYWKPVQSGLEETDTATLRKITQLPDDNFYPETYSLTQPLSPHESARRDGVSIEMDKLQRPTTEPLIVEGAGGLLVPLNENKFVIDLISHLDLPAILVCRSGLGTINHTLLSLEAMHRRNILIAGIIIQGEKAPHNRQALEEYGQVPVIAEIDYLNEVTKENLLAIQPEIDLLNWGNDDKKRRVS